MITEVGTRIYFDKNAINWNLKRSSAFKFARFSVVKRNGCEQGSSKKKCHSVLTQTQGKRKKCL